MCILLWYTLLQSFFTTLGNHFRVLLTMRIVVNLWLYKPHSWISLFSQNHSLLKHSKIIQYYVMCNRAWICTHLHPFAHMQHTKCMKIKKKAWKTYTYDLYICLKGYIYAYITWIYVYMAIYTFAHSLCCIYIYIYIIYIYNIYICSAKP